MCINCGFHCAKNVEKVFYFLFEVLYNKDMKEEFENLSNETQNFNEQDNENVIYDGDCSYRCTLNQADLDNIDRIESRDNVNNDLFVVATEATTGEAMFSLFTEGALSSEKTGRDTGIYTYKPVREVLKQKEAKRKQFTSYEDILNNPIFEDTSSFVYGEIDDSTEPQGILAEGFYEGPTCGFSECMLAQYDPLGGPQTQIIRTFKGYLEVLRPMGVLRASNNYEQDVSRVYVPEFYIDKYKLRNGDEIACVYTEQSGKFVMQSLLSINGETYETWNVDRCWFDEIKCSPKQISAKGSDSNKCLSVIRGLSLRRGDNVFVRLKDHSRELGWLQKFIRDASELFDRVVIVNPKMRNGEELVTADNVVNFSTEFTDSVHNQILACVLGANYVKRLVEMNKTVAFIVDDLNYISTLDNAFNGESPVIKTIFSCIKANKKGGSIMFGLLPYSRVQGYPAVFKAFETVNLIVDRGEADLYSSARL